MQLCLVNTQGRRLPLGSRSANVLADLLIRRSGGPPCDDDFVRSLEGVIEADANLCAWVAQRSGQKDAGTAARWLVQQSAVSFSDVFVIDEPAEGDSAAGSTQADDDASAWTARLLPELARQLARLDDLERRFAETLEAEKLEAMAELAAGAGHEINNPLAVISGRAQLFLRQEDDPQRRQAFASMNTQVGRVFEMISDLMLFARPPEPQRELVDPADVIDQVVADLADVFADRGVTLNCQDVATDDAGLSVSADRTQLIVAVRAVLDNALNELDHHGRIDIALAQSPRDAERTGNDEVRITIRDNGPGIAPEVRRHLFDPFYSGRQAGRGLGMGLAKCWRIVTNHGGRVEVASEPGYGATFTIVLPVAQTADS
ncbi:MAG: HAMP domain-containing sensor histidine kinase [Pirellulales bacterium]